MTAKQSAVAVGCCFGAGILSSLLYIVFPDIVTVEMVVLAVGIALFGFFLWKRRDKLTDNTYTILIFAISSFIKLMYITKLQYYNHQYDVGTLDENGHLGYIHYLLSNGHLPDFDVSKRGQFYHAPLHYVLEAVWLKILSILGLSGDSLYEMLQVLPLMYSGLLVVVFGKILKQLHLNGHTYRITLTVFALHPTFIIMSGFINNDILSALFMLLALYFAFKWKETRSVFDIIGIALSIGLGVSTKLSAWMAAPAVAYLFISVWKSDWKNVKLYTQFAVFLIICAPLSLWWSLYCNINWNIPIGYIPAGIETDYVGAYSEFTRLFTVSSESFQSPYLDEFKEEFGIMFKEYNPLVALLKTACFERFIFSSYFPHIQGTAELLLIANTLLAVSAFCGTLLTVLKKYGDSKQRIMLFLTYAITLGSYISFCLVYPFVCTESIRYATGTIYLALLLYGIWHQQEHGKIGLIFRQIGDGCAILFSGCSALLYGFLLYI